MPASEPDDLPALTGPADDWWNNACLNYTHATWLYYADGYKEAAEKLVEVAGDCTLDTVIFPIAFLYRHYLELQLKRITVLAQRLEDLPCEVPHGHRIDELWDQARAALREAHIPEQEPEPRVTQLIREFAAIDSVGQAFRYPIDTSGTATLRGITHINIRNFGERMAEITQLVEGLAEMLYVYIDLKAEMEEEGRWAADY